MRKGTITRTILLIALLLTAWITRAPVARADYCGTFGGCTNPATPECCSAMWDYCMCDCMDQTNGDYGLCYTACYSELQAYSCV